MPRCSTPGHSRPTYPNPRVRKGPNGVPVMVTGKGRSEKGDWPPVNGAKTVAEVEAEMAKSKIERVKRNFLAVAVGLTLEDVYDIPSLKLA